MRLTLTEAKTPWALSPIWSTMLVRRSGLATPGTPLPVVVVDGAADLSPRVVLDVVPVEVAVPCRPRQSCPARFFLEDVRQSWPQFGRQDARASRPHCRGMVLW